MYEKHVGKYSRPMERLGSYSISMLQICHRNTFSGNNPPQMGPMVLVEPALCFGTFSIVDALLEANLMMLSKID